MAALLIVDRVSKSYPGLPVLKEVSFAADQGEIVCLLGPSGCGKTTLLRLIAGLETPDTGAIAFAGADLAGVPAHRRGFGLMFQEYALFPHKDVAGNVAFGLRMQRLPAAETKARTGDALALVGLTGYERRRVVDLSGGEQQRVALARSLAPRPHLLMLDEPLGSLDRTLREQLMNDLRAILKQAGVTALYVTHDQEEAFAVSDRVLVMRARPETGEGGWIEQAGTPAEVYRHPVSAYVALFLGFRNLLDGVVADASEAGRARVATALGPLMAGDVTQTLAPGQEVAVLVRPEAADVRPPGATGPNIVAGRLLEASFRGSYYLLRTGHAGGVVLTSQAPATGDALPGAGEPLALRLDPAAITALTR